MIDKNKSYAQVDDRLTLGCDYDEATDKYYVAQAVRIPEDKYDMNIAIALIDKRIEIKKAKYELDMLEKEENRLAVKAIETRWTLTRLMGELNQIKKGNLK